MTQTAVHVQTTVGVDIGGTKISAALVKPNALGASERIAGFQEVQTPLTLDGFLSALEQHILELKAKEPVAAVGISTAGVVDSINGRILGSTGNLPAVKAHVEEHGMLDLKQILEARVGLPVHVENDANAAGYGEYRVGAGQGYQNVVAVTLGTGVGTGIILNGRMITGAHFSAGEGGHIAIAHTHERRCTCGRWDCWEAYASGTGLAVTVRNILQGATEVERAPFLNAGANLDTVGTHELIAAWKGGSPLAKQILDIWHSHISVGIRNIINLLDPDVIVVGGGMAQFVDFEHLDAITRPQCLPRDIRIVPAQLGNQAGIYGAACLALDVLVQTALNEPTV